MEMFNLILDSSWQVIGYFTFIFILLFRRQMLAFKIQHITSFITLMVLLFILRISYADFLGNYPAGQNYTDFGGLLLVFIEDFAFVAPGLLLDKKLRKSKWLFYGFWFLMSAWFAYGHRCYSVHWMCITFFYPYFIARKYSLKTCIMTVGICHVIYDFATVLTDIFLRG